MATRDYLFDKELCRELNRQRYALEAEYPKLTNYNVHAEYVQSLEDYFTKVRNMNELAKNNTFIRIFDGSYKLDLTRYPAHN